MAVSLQKQCHFPEPLVYGHLYCKLSNSYFLQTQCEQCSWVMNTHLHNCSWQPLSLLGFIEYLNEHLLGSNHAPICLILASGAARHLPAPLPDTRQLSRVTPATYGLWDSPGQNTGVGSLPFSRGSSQPRDWTQVSCIADRFFTSWATREACYPSWLLPIDILWNGIRGLSFLQAISDI